jgi:hypothetical protein
MKRSLLTAGILALTAFGGLAGLLLRERTEARRELEGLREELWVSRSKADSCQFALASEQEELLRFGSYLDSLHAQVRGFEDTEQGGVPGDEYGEYLATFDRYNDSVAVWKDRADALRATEAYCRVLAEAHNALQDSIRGRFPEVSGDPR